MTPGHGSGAGQAAEDAYVLGAILADPSTTLTTLSMALKVYEEIRLPFANDIQRRSMESSDMFTFSDPRFTSLDNATEADMGKLWDFGFTVVESWKWAWTTDVEGDKNRAIALLRERTQGLCA